MNPIEFIRMHVFDGISQEEFGKLAGVEQPTVSRWENDAFKPNGRCMGLIRAAALERGKAWDDRWFFEAPERAATPGRAA